METARHRPAPPAPRLDIVLAAGLVLGAVAALSLPQALAPLPCWALLGLSLMLWLALPRARFPAGMGAGFSWAMLVATWGMEARLPPALEGADLIVEGRVVGLPEARVDATRFGFAVESGEGEAAALDGTRLQLSWYRTRAQLEPGSRWRLAVRLKRPRGTLNPGGFDYERHALERRIVATGHVLEGDDTRALAPGRGIDALRLRLSETIGAAVDAPRARFVQALAVGDVRGLDGDDWHVLRATGIAHLIAISGLHVGMVAGFGALLARLLYRMFPALGVRRPLPQAAALAALLAAAGYTALAGFALPTVRTLLMIAAALLAVLMRRRLDPVQAFALALIAVLVADPLAVLNAGFWLSFLGVAWLLWCLPRAMDTAWWRTLASVQGVMTLGLLPLTVWFFGQASVAGPLCNLLAVPWVSFAVVPTALVGTLLELLWSGAGDWAFRLSAWLMQGLWIGLEPVASLHGSLVYLPEPSPVAFVLALAGAFWLLLPRGMPGKAMALLLFAPLLLPAREKLPAGSVELVVFDVGQGLSVLLQTANHAVLYDAGPAFPGGLDMGEAAVVPALRALGVSGLDLFIVSHADNDHAGGADAVRRAYAPAEVRTSRDRPAEGEAPCEAGREWRFDDIVLRLLHPPEHFPYLGNDSSCVLRVEDARGVPLALLPGDIGHLIEQRLVREQSERLSAPVLVVPHHGSRTSSSPAFIDAVSPGLALIGSGYRNRFGLPREDVLERYRERGIALADTAQGGALRLRIDASGAHGLQRERERRRRLWREGR